VSSEEVPTAEDPTSQADETVGNVADDEEVQADRTVEEPTTKAKQDVENAKADLADTTDAAENNVSSPVAGYHR
jgi:uncharacterized protein YjbJ (UPF0337 family)